MAVKQWLNKLKQTKLINRGAGPTCHRPRGGQTPGQQGLTCRRLDAGEAETAEAFGFLAPAAKRRAERLCGFLALVRIRRR